MLYWFKDATTGEEFLVEAMTLEEAYEKAEDISEYPECIDCDIHPYEAEQMMLDIY